VIEISANATAETEDATAAAINCFFIFKFPYGLERTPDLAGVFLTKSND